MSDEAKTPGPLDNVLYVDCCIACAEPLKEGDDVYNELSGGIIHAACCGPERESYHSTDEQPLADDEPIPKPWKWTAHELMQADLEEAALGLCGTELERFTSVQLKDLLTTAAYLTDRCLVEIEKRGELEWHEGAPRIPYNSDHIIESVLTRPADSRPEVS